MTVHDSDAHYGHLFLQREGELREPVGDHLGLHEGSDLWVTGEEGGGGYVVFDGEGEVKQGVLGGVGGGQQQQVEAAEG